MLDDELVTDIVLLSAEMLRLLAWAVHWRSGQDREFRGVSQRLEHFHDGVDFTRGVGARQVAAVVQVDVTFEHAKHYLMRALISSAVT